MARQNEDVTKLPKWAQDYIARLERDFKYVKDQQYLVDNGKTAVSWVTMLEEPHYLPSVANVTFVTDYGRVRVSLRDGSLDVNCDLVMTILPRGANTVLIRPEKWTP